MLDELLLADAALQHQLLVHDDAHLLALRNELFRRLDRVRLDEHLVHPLAADVLRRVAQIRHHRDSVQRLPLRVAIREHEPAKSNASFAVVSSIWATSAARASGATINTARLFSCFIRFCNSFL